MYLLLADISLNEILCKKGLSLSKDVLQAANEGYNLSYFLDILCALHSHQHVHLINLLFDLFKHV